MVAQVFEALVQHDNVLELGIVHALGCEFSVRFKPRTMRGWAAVECVPVFAAVGLQSVRCRVRAALQAHCVHV